MRSGVCFEVEDLDTGMAKVRELGGKADEIEEFGGL